MFAVVSPTFDDLPSQLRFPTSFAAIVVIARPDIATFFLSKVKDMPIIQKGQVAIVIFDSGNVLTYDIMRLYKLMLEKELNLGAAAQSTFLMTGLPSSDGFDMRSRVLQSVGLRDRLN
ncbi:unnamed protein product [Dibothriocephalus latus]|uniref:Uncharacterized protein n=1 Tax=Dibothriocephalus latus TaxID=60516 RepID=A0A3P6QI55_DIBLA|nr:unnamed protein product [Dibothriocephalus latus]